MKLIDMTVPIRSGMFVHEGDPEVHLERVSSIAAGDPANLSRIDSGVQGGTRIDAALDVPGDTPRPLFRTPNSRLWERDTFSKDFIGFVESGARRIVEQGVRLLGTDHLSIGDTAAHRAFLEAGVAPLEGLDLRSAEPGRHRLLCLPIRIEGCDGATARTLLLPPAREGENR